MKNQMNDYKEIIDIAINNVKYDLNHCGSPSYLQDLNIILRTLEYIKEAAENGKR